MIAFITSLRHPWNCVCYEKLAGLLSRTLQSVCNQSDPNFVVLVVVNQKPALPFFDARIQFVEVDFPPACRERGKVPNLDEVRMDKGLKLIAGLVRARALDASHVMFFDFDDFLHRDIAKFAATHPNVDGWYVIQGYVHWAGSGRVTPAGGFHKLCGSSHVLNCRVLEISGSLKAASSKNEILRTCGESYVTKIIGMHIYIAEYLIGKGFSIQPLPFRAAIWERGTGDNMGLAQGFLSAAGIKITDQIRRDFQLEIPARSYLQEVRASWNQALPVWTYALEKGGIKSAVFETFGRGSLRAIRRLMGEEWKL